MIPFQSLNNSLTNPLIKNMSSHTLLENPIQRLKTNFSYDYLLQLKKKSLLNDDLEG